MVWWCGFSVGLLWGGRLSLGHNKNRGTFLTNWIVIDSQEGLLRGGTVRNLQPSNNQQTRTHREKQTTHKVSVLTFLTQQTVAVTVRSAGWSMPGLGHLFSRTHFWQGAEWRHCHQDPPELFFTYRNNIIFGVGTRVPGLTFSYGDNGRCQLLDSQLPAP